MISLGFVGTIASVLVGAVVAAVTVVGVVTHTVDGAGSNPADAGKPTISYGSTR